MENKSKRGVHPCTRGTGLKRRRDQSIGGHDRGACPESSAAAEASSSLTQRTKMNGISLNPDTTHPPPTYRPAGAIFFFCYLRFLPSLPSPSPGNSHLHFCEHYRASIDELRRNVAPTLACADCNFILPACKQRNGNTLR